MSRLTSLIVKYVIYEDRKAPEKDPFFLSAAFFVFIIPAVNLKNMECFLYALRRLFL